MDLLGEAGFDVSDWYNYKGQPPSRNPKYCLNWSFEQPGEAIAVCLLHRSLIMRDGRVAYRRKPSPRASRPREPGSNLWNQRNHEFGARLELAFRQQLPVRVIVIEGKERNPADPKPKASKVESRILDKDRHQPKDRKRARSDGSRQATFDRRRGHRMIAHDVAYWPVSTFGTLQHDV
jgi:5-methylcytosine-specific restriction enzyme A